MGCCFSCFNNGDNKSQSGEPNERTTLLGNPVSNNISRPLFSQDFSDVASGQLGDEQAALNKILHQTAIDIIDVSAIPTHIEQKDFIDRVKLYQRRLRDAFHDASIAHKSVEVEPQGDLVTKFGVS
ncbi:hypothetical protein CEXT_341951 [Caerostris extrusa]|uniref:Ragulator complex protein LAMTOR1 n=1 Tax=Caerostris extrusa TaxID=172846 RepID=A0AAV4R9L3_CAEEX|nr:hypothetical protein CEXT_341951 [Caerostris extrusa]